MSSLLIGSLPTTDCRNCFRQQRKLAPRVRMSRDLIYSSRDLISFWGVVRTCDQSKPSRQRGLLQQCMMITIIWIASYGVRPINWALRMVMIVCECGGNSDEVSLASLSR